MHSFKCHFAEKNKNFFFFFLRKVYLKAIVRYIFNTKTSTTVNYFL